MNKNLNSYIGGKNYWNNKFFKRKSPLEADNFLKENIKFFKKGNLLDIACGDGRNAIHLSKLDFNVLGIDFSKEAIKKLKFYSKIENQKIKILKFDLNKNLYKKRLGKFDTIIVNHYKLNKQNLNNIHKLLNKNGILYVCGFSDKTIELGNLKKKDLLKKEDFNHLKKTLKLLFLKESKLNNDTFIQLIFTKNN